MEQNTLPPLVSDGPYKVKQIRGGQFPLVQVIGPTLGEGVWASQLTNEDLADNLNAAYEQARKSDREVIQALCDALKGADKWMESAGRERFAWDDNDVERALSHERSALALAKSQCGIEPKTEQR